MSHPWLDPAWRPSESGRATVVFVHGAIVRGWEMALLRRRLRRFGFRVKQFQYRSMRLGLNENARLLKDFLDATEGDTLHVVGHSMGGVLIRRVFERDPDSRPGRLVAIGSPLVGCWIGRHVNGLHRRFGRYLIGRTVADHVACPGGGAWSGRRDFGVLAGTYPVGIGAVFPSHPRPSDGVVLLEETRLPGIQGHVTFRLNHFGMLFSRRCCAEVACFLATGSFSRGGGGKRRVPGRGDRANALKSL